jgi:hypothetical protein
MHGREAGRGMQPLMNDDDVNASYLLRRRRNQSLKKHAVESLGVVFALFLSFNKVLDFVCVARAN